MKRAVSVAILTLGLYAGTLPAQDPPPVEDAPLPPPLPNPVQSGEALEPEVTIVETGKGTAYEYRINGHLYMVKIQPSVGPPYYLLDTNGDGVLDVRENRVWNNSIPQWVLFSW
jgi:hypothetical protein